MTFPTNNLAHQALRFYSSRHTFSRADRFGAAITAAYCCLAFSAPFAGAALVSRRYQQDGRYAKMYVHCWRNLRSDVADVGTRRPLSFRDCLPGSPLEDYVGLRRKA